MILVGILFWVGCQSKYTECTEEKALLDIELVRWGENLYNDNEVLFNYYVYNYGYKEAKNVYVKCTVLNNGTNKKSITEYVGNIASTSSTFKETKLEYLQSESKEGDTGVCHVASCNNCEILYKRIPTLIEIFE